jgi:hypothetical protein
MRNGRRSRCKRRPLICRSRASTIAIGASSPPTRNGLRANGKPSKPRRRARERWNAACRLDADQRVNQLQAQMYEIVRCTTTSILGLEDLVRDLSGENRTLKSRLSELETALVDLKIERSTGKVVDLTQSNDARRELR